ncbi:ABC transporter substrate-binding protein [Paenibacillus aurantius]|uniref:ABC transporter substrate-binding protein n=1 Tax=Paenibacillus aurantius TaxID=2918900 RepID=A0AA96LBU6_9BACL|nr:ABC transporter substrate-binding protein [Paenibacillus aurantius]WJH35007.1 ABC transporter substrate-binding protein [Paenibacillus sp. CC-CFT747]WNQ10263.1 ABC transporter substrate-binding protein [Paenibacillus aurantius]
MAMKKWFAGMTAAALVMVTAGCGGGGTKDTAAEPSAAPVVEDTTPVTIQYWHAHAEAQMAGLNYMIDEFQKKYPYIKVEPVFQGAYTDLQKKLQAAIAAKDVPAVTNVEVSAVANFADSGAFEELTPYIKRDKIDMNDFSKGMLQAYAYNNKQYGFPLIVSTSVMVYNKTLFDKLGVKPPEKWSDIEDFNKKVTVKEGGKTTRYAFSVPGWDTWYYDPWISNGGGAILTPDGEKTALDQPDSQRWIQNFKKWIDDGSLMMGYGKGASDTMRQMFLEEKIGMVQHTSAVIKTYLENAKFEVGVSFIPGDKERKSHIGGAGIVMMSGAKKEQKEAAWKFIQFMTEAKNNVKWAESTGYLPTHKSVVTSEEGKAFFQKYPQYKAVFDNFDNVGPRPQHPGYPEMSAVYKEVVGEMALNGKDPVPLLKDSIKKMNDILSEY